MGATDFFHRAFTKIKNTRSDPLHANSIYIMLSSVAASGIGLLFWILAARTYPQEDIGIATALISSIGLLVSFSRLGFDQSMIRFTPVMDKGKVFSTSVIISTAFAVVLGVIFIMGINVWSPDLKGIKDIALPYLLVLTFSSIAAVMTISFISLRRSKLAFFQNVVMGSRLLFLFALGAFGTVGIFYSFGLGFLVAILFSIPLLIRMGVKMTSIDREFINQAFKYSAGNYFTGLIVTAPNLIVPLLVLGTLGASSTAVYYIAFSFASIAMIVPISTSTSLFVEGSHGESLILTTRRAVISTMLMLIPTIIFFTLAGGILLGIIGQSYVQGGLELLRVLVFSSIFFAIFQIYLSVKRVQKDLKALVFLGGLNSALLLGLSYTFMKIFGLIGVGYAFIVAYGLTCAVILFMMKKEGWFRAYKGG